MSDNTDILNEIQKSVLELRQTNDAKFAELEKKGSSDTLFEDKLNKMNDNITALQKKMQRPSLNGVEVDPAVSEHKEAWGKWMRKQLGENQLEVIQRKAVEITGGDADGLTTGGYLMPKTVEAGVYSALTSLSPIRAESDVVQVSGDDYRFISDDGEFESGWVGETDARPETATNSFNETKVNMGEVYANPHATQRALDDVAFNLDAYIINRTSRSFAKQQNIAFVRGNGVDKPMGFTATPGITTVNTGVAYNGTTGAGLPTSPDAYIKMIYSLATEYRAGSKFFAPTLAQVGMRLMKDSTNNYLWQNSLIEGQPDKFAGYAIVTTEEMPDLAVNSLSVAFANLKLGYLIADRLGIRTLRDPYSKKGYVGFYSTARTGGCVRDKKAFVLLKTSA